ncbi:3',5'-cyclic AMP phosphodiesterase CpdA [Lacibacter cauensis]|uniref:3',5'-cyclic AMP phosphodiesterase CpdA n=1 Tax=Lacibacter cauensis TaxID=510947 RepID=A0A562SW54_9BACT|nr:calcineurin-like phosphoesterase family protein [Lacibacter cauensis]TWI85529.1 3',5'-cyclic AMP phosphodiesterase CpdA [Lacibacter cauensis]
MKRKDFFKLFGFAATGLALPPLATKAAVNEQSLQQPVKPVTVTGKVIANGKGIAGVAVTDGTSIVLTDKNGNYTLEAAAGAEFVYISLPAGYAFPNEKKMATFYKTIDTKTENFVADFTLEKLTVDDSKHCFVVWADTQMISEKDVELLKTQSVPDLQQLVESYPTGTLFHGIGCGDLVWDKFELFKGYKEAIAATGVTFFNVIGNHDMDIKTARTDEWSAETFKKEFGPTYYSFNRGKIHYVVLDDVFFIGTAKKYIGYITENQLSWLEQDLKNVSKGSTVVVSLHIPTDTGAARRYKKEAELGSNVSNREQLYKILADYKVHFMSGHTHFNDVWEKENMMEHNHGTVCGAWWTGPVCGDGTPSGYGVYEVDGNELTWYYKSTGLPKEHQVTVFEKGRSKDYPDEIIANVWNWDSKWKVEWFEDGAAKGAMEQRVAFDPLAVELYSGPELPKKHKFVEPTLADHIFFAKPSAGAKEIEVKVTDRFGKVYSVKKKLA